MKKIINKASLFFDLKMFMFLTFIINIEVFVLMNSVLHHSIIISSIVASIVSVTINYFVNRKKVYNNKYFKLWKYILINLVIMTLSIILVGCLSKYFKIQSFIIKIIIDLFLLIINYYWQKKVLFSENRNVKLVNKITLFVMSLCTSISFVLQKMPLFNDISSLKVSSFFSNTLLISSILVILLYIFYLKFYNNTIKRNGFKVLSAIFSIFLVVGFSFHLTDSFKLVSGNLVYFSLSILKFIGFYNFFNVILNLLYEWILNFKINKNFKNKYFKYFEKHPMKTSIIIMGIVYGIYLIAYYPGVVGYDPSNQLIEYLGMPSVYTPWVNLINKDIYITGFNPVLHTLLIGGLFDIGNGLINANFGIFLYTLLQVSVTIWILSYTIKFMMDEGVPSKILLCVLGIYVFVPFFPFYSLTLWKDSFYSLFFILYVIELYKFIKYEVSLKNSLIMILACIGLCSFRNNGLIIILLSLPFVFFLKKKNKRYLFLIIGCSILFQFTYNKVIELCDIPSSSIKEVLSVPIQQISALVTNKEEVIEDDDRVVIGKILDYNQIKELYDPELVDSVKGTFNKNYTNEELNDFMRVWFKYLKKEPKIYVEATINNNYGYLYPDDHQWYFYHKKYNTLNDAGIDYQYNGLNWLRKVFYGYGTGFSYVPLVGLLVNIGMINWTYLYLGVFLMENKNKKYLILLLPAIVTMLGCLAGPVNTYFRYILPLGETLPFVLCMLYQNRKSVKDTV